MRATMTADELERRLNAICWPQDMVFAKDALCRDAIAALREAERREAVLRNRAEEAEDELEAWRKWDNGDACNADLMAERDALALRLRGMGMRAHNPGCAIRTRPGVPCDCGLSALLAPPTTEGKTDE